MLLTHQKNIKDKIEIKIGYVLNLDYKTDSIIPSKINILAH